MNGLTLDAGALIAFEKGDRLVLSLLSRGLKHKKVFAIPAGVVGQVWRDGRRQARLARLLASDAVEVEALDDHRARAAGQLCGATGSADIVDASVVICARARRQAIVTSDASDLLALDSSLDLVRV